ncbi:DUF2931 family protein [Myroides albus]|uniref:DUF2931 family protein n=1 Tax=Myroides albus TaxID=2562892 RepID=UPI0021596710|nr:DUF2931 family protein [Myroides albus]UVD78453.1 DUF2931 family protein [Myroides albus]
MNKWSIFLVLSVLMVGCIKTTKNSNKKEVKYFEKYEWYARESWDGRFPMYFHDGYYILEDGSTKYIPNGYTAGSWGTPLSLHASGETTLPVGLSVKYVSFVEKKCYGGEFELPIDTIKKYFRQGVIEEFKGESTGYRNIITGITPGGTVVVWIGGISTQIEIARFKAEEIKLSVKEIWPNSSISEEDFYDIKRSDPDKYAYIQEYGLPLGIWDKYRTRFNWELKWDLPKGYEVYQYKVEMYNAERVNPILFFKENPLNPFKGKAKAIPVFTRLNINKKGTKQIDYVVMRYDFEEMYALMSKVSSPETPITIHIKVNDDFSTEWYVEIEGVRYPIKGREPIIITYGQDSDEDRNWRTYEKYLKNPDKAL